MLSEEQLRQLKTLTAQLSPAQIAWTSGYLAGQVEGNQTTSANATHANAGKLLIYYATETNNSKDVAQKLAQKAKSAGFQVRVASVRDAKPAKFSELKESPVIFVCSTHGEGDPPEMARSFFEALRKIDQNCDLSSLRYAVLGLGDKSYAKYCQAALDLRNELVNRKAQELLPVTLLDVDFADHIPAWIESVIKNLGGATTTSVSVSSTPVTVTKTSSRGTNRLNPVEASIVHKVNLNDRGSNKETWHIEVELSEGVAYEPGDALGIILPQAEGAKPEPARLYSIASSNLVDASQVHLTVALATYMREDGTRGFGKCSHYLSQMQIGDKLQVYVHRNPRFRLPADDKDIIMIGPGTGVAPFRAFIQQRQELGATGRNWLFFGDQRAHCDFLYQSEWQEHLAGGSLHAISLAFSRDQKHKRYVQHLMQESRDQLREWLDNGAYVYVCGTKDPMSNDVEKCLAQIVASDLEQGRAILEQWSEEGRYMKDVY